jgi:hypothetical protein
MRKLIVKVTAVIEVEIPDKAPDSDYIEKILDWKINDWEDGRYPFHTEMVQQGAAGIVRYGVENSISQDIYRRPRYDRNEHIAERNLLEDTLCSQIRCHAADGGRLEIKVTEERGDEDRSA